MDQTGIASGHDAMKLHRLTSLEPVDHFPDFPLSLRLGIRKGILDALRDFRLPPLCSLREKTGKPVDTQVRPEYLDVFGVIRQNRR
jgi:hypothetical protein